jgi:hypothetical protein
MGLISKNTRFSKEKINQSDNKEGSLNIVIAGNSNFNRCKITSQDIEGWLVVTQTE